MSTPSVQMAAVAFGAGFLAHKLLAALVNPQESTQEVDATEERIPETSTPRRRDVMKKSPSPYRTPPDSPGRNNRRDHSESVSRAPRMSFMASPSGTPESDHSIASSARMSGVKSAAAAAFQLADAIFSYEAGDADALSTAVREFESEGETNVFGRIPSYHKVSTRSGAGRIVVGASAAGISNVSVFAPSQTLPLMLPAIKEMAQRSVPAVFHCLAQVMTNDLSFHADVSGVLMVRDAGATVMASYSVQECFNMALVAHIVAIKTGIPVIHTFDGAHVARTSAVIKKLSFTRDLVDSVVIQENTPVAGVVDAAFASVASFIGKRYSLFEVPKPALNAANVLVTFGPGSGAIARAAASRDIHVIVVRVYRPWSSKHFIAALPEAVRRGSGWTLGVATLNGRSSVNDALTADILSTLATSTERIQASPTLVKFHIAPTSAGVTPGMAGNIAETLVVTTNNATVHVTEQNSSKDKRFDDAGQSISVWGTAGAASVPEVLQALEIQAHAERSYTMHSLVESDHVHPLEPSHARVVLNHTISAEDDTCIPDKCDVVVVADPVLLESHSHDIAEGLLPDGQSTLIVVSNQGAATAADLLDSFPENLKSAVAQAESRVLTITADDASPEVVAQESLAAALSNGTAGKPFPAKWRVISKEEGHSDRQKFTRRLSTVNFAATTELTSSSLEAGKVKVSDSHRVTWDYIFSDNKLSGAKEVLRPDEHGTLYRVKCTKNQRLTPESYHRNVFHLEFDISGTGLTYNIGDALGVFGHNDSTEVAAFIDAYGLQPLDFVSIPRESGEAELLTVTQLLKTRLDIFGKPSQKFYAALAHFATDTYQNKKLAWLGSEDKEGFRLRQFETATFADVLMEFPSARPSITDLIDLVPTIKPRHYSISSSMKMCPTSVHLLVVAVDWTTPQGRKRFGQCTRYLAGLDPNADEQWVTVDIKPSVCHLPADPKTPVVCAGLGTGLAPFRAFVQERMYLKQQGVEVGPMAMYFGARYRAQEYLYEEDLEAAAKAGVITDLRLAFSRDQAKKVYIQDLIRDDKHKLAQYFKVNGGFFYLCGPTWPVPDVRAAIHDGLQSAGGLSADAADSFLEEMKEEGRYILEVY